VSALPTASATLPDTVGAFVREAAARDPQGTAVVAPAGAGWRKLTFAELDQRSDAMAHGLLAAGIGPGTLTLVMVRAGLPLIALTHALFKAGAVPVLIDPGMGRAAFLKCVERTQAEAFVGIPLAQALRRVLRKPFASIRTSVTVGRRWFWGGPTLDGLLAAAPRTPFPIHEAREDDVAAVLFTSGSTGPAKGTVYTQGNFLAQVRQLKKVYGFRPGEVDLAAFPLFSLFDAALGMTSVIPDLDPSRPGRCDPAKVVDAIRTHRATTAFGSPAIWKRVAPYCHAQGLRLPGLKRVLVAGAPVPPALIRQMHGLLDDDADVLTPYGATEALPVSSMAGREVAAETAEATARGEGSCVGRPVPGMDVRVIRIDDGPIPQWDEALVVPDGEVGELCVRGDVVTRAYHNLPEATAGAKIAQGRETWHRMGDLGRRDAQGRLWYLGRKAERVETTQGPIFTDAVEGIANAHPKVGRSALVGVGPRGSQRPVLVVEGPEDASLVPELMASTGVTAVLFHDRFPVDVRHNAKIHRLTLAQWAAERLR
jgi:acyl-CoA synthetase (AMP-forming)/AMP-acid ligase II